MQVRICCEALTSAEQSLDMHTFAVAPPGKSHSLQQCHDIVAVRAQRRRGSRADPVSEDDILRAIAKLGVLGGGFAVVKVGERRLVRVQGRLRHCHKPKVLAAKLLRMHDMHPRGPRWSCRRAPASSSPSCCCLTMSSCNDLPSDHGGVDIPGKRCLSDASNLNLRKPAWLQVRSVPGELSTDTNAVLRLAQAAGHVAKPQVVQVSAASASSCR